MLGEIKPITKGRPRMGRRRRVYTPATTLAFEANLRDIWVTQHGDEPLDCPVWLDIIIGKGWVYADVWPLVASVRPVGVTGDIDNYAKSVSDALNGAAYVDDRQVHHLTAGFSKELWTP